MPAADLPPAQRHMMKSQTLHGSPARSKSAKKKAMQAKKDKKAMEAQKDKKAKEDRKRRKKSDDDKAGIPMMTRATRSSENQEVTKDQKRLWHEDQKHGRSGGTRWHKANKATRLSTEKEARTWITWEGLRCNPQRRRPGGSSARVSLAQLGRQLDASNQIHMAMWDLSETQWWSSRSGKASGLDQEEPDGRRVAAHNRLASHGENQTPTPRRAKIRFPILGRKPCRMTSSTSSRTS
eukprot:s4234_g2.t1